MGNEVPISKVKPTYSSIRQVKFTNIDNEDFIHAMGGKKFKFKKGISVMIPENMAFHFARNLAQKIIFRDDESKLKYAGINEQLSRERTNRGENPLIVPVTKEVVENLMDIILNHYKKTDSKMEEVLDIEDFGQVVPSKVEAKTKTSETKSEKTSSEKKAKKEEKDDIEFEDLEG